MKNKIMRKGFTLIELLVVIAIIGILSSVVLSSLSTARDKGANAAAKANLANTRAQAELFYDTGRTYDGVCADSNGIASLVAAAGEVAGVTAECADAATAWAAEVQLKDSEGYYCVDYTGQATTTANGGGSTIEDGSDYVCG